MGAYTDPLKLTSPLAHGQRVKDAQWLLSGQGKVLKKKCYQGAIDGQYGPHCAGATKHAKYWLGYPNRKCDTAFGQTLYDYLVGRKKLSAFMHWRIKHREKIAKEKAKQGGLYKKALVEAEKFIGVKEEPWGSNRQEFGVWYGLNGVPWCAIFQSYVLSHVGRAFRYSYVPAILEDARMGRGRMRTVPYSQVQDCINHGHVVLACFGWGGYVAEHVGMVVRDIGGGTFETIDGNTGTSNFSNGGEVMQCTRYTSQVLGFVEVYD